MAARTLSLPVLIGVSLGPALAAGIAAAMGWGGVASVLAGVVAALAAIGLVARLGIREKAGIGAEHPPEGGSGAADRADAEAARGAGLRAIFDAADATILATSGSGSVLLCNRGACDLLERGAEQIVGREIGDLFSHVGLLEAHGAALAGQERRGQVRLSRGGAVRLFQVVAAPLGRVAGESAGADAPSVVLTLRDVTELARADQLKTDFVANASHELRTPLAAIRAAVETLEDLNGEDPAMSARLVRMIASNAERLEDLTRDLLDLSRLESPEARVEVGPVDLGALVGSVTALLEPAARARGVTIGAALAPEALAVESDARLLSVILRNLTENAVKFAYEGTEVRVESEVIGAGPGEARAGLRLRVIDRGIGIPLHQQARIFERFFQGDPARAGEGATRGTGLGLAIVKHAVRALGGAVSVESVWKEGTTMTVELPGCVVGGGPAPDGS